MTKKNRTIIATALCLVGCAFAQLSPTSAQAQAGDWAPDPSAGPNIVVQGCTHERALLSTEYMPGRTGHVYAKLACSNPNARVISGGCMLQFAHRTTTSSWAISGSYPFEGSDILDTPDSGEAFWELDGESGWVCTADNSSLFLGEPAKIAVSAVCCR